MFELTKAQNISLSQEETNWHSVAGSELRTAIIQQINMQFKSILSLIVSFQLWEKVKM